MNSNLRNVAMILASAWLSSQVYAQSDITNPGIQQKIVNDTKAAVTSKVTPLLDEYCGKYCRILSVEPEITEEAVASDDIGFESAVGGERPHDVKVSKITMDIQIETRVSGPDRVKLDRILQLNLKSLSTEVVVNWQAVDIPRLAGGDINDPALEVTTAPPPVFEVTKDFSGAAQPLRLNLEKNISAAINAIINRYCPEQCIVERIDIFGDVVPSSEAKGLPASQVIMDSAGEFAFKVNNVEVDVTMDDSLDEATRNKILSLMRSQTRFVSPIDFNLGVTAFPEPYAKIRQKAEKEAEDPYGLEKLRQMLILFRDLAGTKEIITNTSTSAELRDRTISDSKISSTSSSKSEVESHLESSSTSESKEKRSDTLNNSETTGQSITTEEIAAYAAGFILLVTLMAIVLIKFNRANKDAREMVYAQNMSDSNTQYGENTNYGDAGQGAGFDGARRQETSSGMTGGLTSKLNNQRLKDELIHFFVQNPKVARETFARFVKEDGIEETAKYVHIFGHMVVFELLDDPNFKRDLYELSEFYHGTQYSFTEAEEAQLLARLKTRLTASNIKVLSRKHTEKFDFLGRLDAGQVYTLVVDESLQVQTIVLAQLDRKKRSAVFDMYQGQRKVDLMAQLSMAEAIPKEYLSNVASALQKKVTARPEFDTENLRASEILIDLLEKATLQEQRELMTSLQTSNPETARSIKMKLVTVEMMPYLKDGHLLEIVLGMEREELLAFLLGAREHIRSIILSKAPPELADSWIEDLEVKAGVDEQTHRLAEIKIISRIRNLANSGSINLLDINEVIFSRQAQQPRVVEQQTQRNQGRSSMVA
jgi:flagellar motor switch protein FliG